MRAATDIRRVPLGAFPVAGGKSVVRVEVHHLTLPPGGKTGGHTHPGPVVSHVVEGTIRVAVQNGPAATYTAGQTIFEPGGTPITSFDNASDAAPATFVATYLLGDGDAELIHML